MKHLTTLLALLLSCSMLAQGPVEFPWNPDADGDDFIGVNDLMALLGEFDSVFSEEALYLSEDSLSAMYDAGTMNYVECQLECSTLPGQWKMPRLSEVQVAGQAMWIETPQREVLHTGSYFNVKYITPGGNLDDEDLSYNRECFCVTKERPKVEYSFCGGGDPSDAGFTQCINEKLAEGWYPLSGFPSNFTRDGYGNHANNGSGDARVTPVQQTHASFWRWAE